MNFQFALRLGLSLLFFTVCNALASSGLLSIKWATYYGGQGDQQNPGINETRVCLDQSGHLYLAVTTQANDSSLGENPANEGLANGGVNDILLAKFDASTGERIWSRYLGGSDIDILEDLCYDPTTDSVYVSGHTFGSDFPLLNAYDDQSEGYLEAFLAKIDAQGKLLWSTYIGGKDGEIASSIAVDAWGDVYVAGGTKSREGIALGDEVHKSSIEGGEGLEDCYVMKFSGDGSVKYWGTYYGGIESDGMSSIAVVTGRAPNGQIQPFVFLAGTTLSTEGIAHGKVHQSTFGGGFNDGFITLLDGMVGKSYWGTYYGGGATDQVRDITIDTKGKIYITGLTNSENQIAYGTVHQSELGSAIDAYDAFVAKFTDRGQILWGSYFGGESTDVAHHLVCDRDAYLYLAGWTQSTAGIHWGDLYWKVDGFAGGLDPYDGWLAKFDSQGKCWAGTTIGGQDRDVASGLALYRHPGGQKEIYLSGQTTSADSIATPGSYQPELLGKFDSDAFLIHFREGLDFKLKE